MPKPQNWPDHYIDVTLDDFERRSYCAIGVFTAWFAACEDMLTYILAYLTDAGDTEKFHLVVSGMDARVKCERLRKAIRAYSDMDGNFKERLGFYEGRIIKTRNKLAHSLCTPLEREKRIYFNHFSRTHLDARKPDHINLEDLLCLCDWLAWYANDLQECARRVPETGKVRIDDPQSPPPKVFG
jgi:hypothetical protein